jgi:hypothetical protein
VLPRLATPKRRTQHRGGPAILRRRQLKGEEPPDRSGHARERRTDPSVSHPLPLAGAGELRHLTASGRDTILDHASAASRRVIFDGRQESSNESSDRTWRRWVGYCRHVGYGADPLLTLLSDRERDLFLRAFLNFYRTAEWDAGGKPAGDRREPVVASTLRKTASNLAAAFRIHIRDSPLHLKGSPNMRPFVRAWLKACDNVDPPKRKQKAAPPQLLRAMFGQSGAGTESGKDTNNAVISEIAIAAYFFAMRACEITDTTTPGRTKIIRLKGIVFRDARHREIPHSSQQELRMAKRVTVTFENQKNGLKMDKRTHERTGDAVMCPVLRLSSLVLRIMNTVPNAGPKTPVSRLLKTDGARVITGSELRWSLRSACTKGGGVSTLLVNAFSHSGHLRPSLDFHGSVAFESVATSSISDLLLICATLNASNSAS